MYRQTNSATLSIFVCCNRDIIVAVKLNLEVFLGPNTSTHFVCYGLEFVLTVIVITDYACIWFINEPKMSALNCNMMCRCGTHLLLEIIFRLIHPNAMRITSSSIDFFYNRKHNGNNIVVRIEAKQISHWFHYQSTQETIL